MTPREWATEMLMAAPTASDLAAGGRGIEPSRIALVQIAQRIEDAVLERAAIIAEQDLENRGRIAAAIRAFRHGDRQ